MPTVLSLLVCCLACASPHAASGAGIFPTDSASAGMIEVFSGRVEINTTWARYSVYASDSGPSVMADAALASGWAEFRDEEGRSFDTPAGNYSVSAYRRGRETLLLASPRGGAGLFLAALFEGDLLWAGEKGEAPGDEPAGVPRPVPCRRILHIKAEKWKAAWYLTAAPAESVVRDGARRFASAGWKVEKGDEGLFVAWRDGSGQVTVKSYAGEKDTCFFILATGGGM